MYSHKKQLKLEKAKKQLTHGKIQSRRYDITSFIHVK